MSKGLDLAKKKSILSIWYACLIEGYTITLWDVDKCLHGETENLAEDQVMFINNMKAAYDFATDMFGTKNDLMLIREINKTVGKDMFHGNGELRTKDVSISGTSWKPAIPIEGVVREEIEKLNDIKDPEARGLSFFCYLIRNQIFIDGNKRVAQVVANKILLENGVGMILINDHIMTEFREVLIMWYETGNPEEMLRFLREKCLVKE